MKCALAAFVVCIASFFGGCTPDLGLSPFKCNRGSPECPAGYTCAGQTPQFPGVCVKDGQPLGDLGRRRDGAADGVEGGPLEGGPLEGGPLEGGPGDRGPALEGVLPPDGPPPPPSGKIVITEFMADPKAANDTTGEYVELFNPGKASVDINGWTIKDQGTDSHKIAAPGGTLIVPAGGFIVLGRNTDKAKNGGVDVAYAYDNFFLSNSTGGDEIVLVDGSGTTIESMAYSAAKGFTITEGASLSTKNPFGNKSDAANWCTEAKAWSGSAGDFGSPRANPGCK